MEEMVQGSESWLEWRRQGIGASEVPCLMGELEYTTPLKLWKEKTGLAKTDDWGSRNIFAKGHENEMRVRAAYEFEQENDFPPAQFENPDHPELRASLDGWCEKLWKGCEIKFVGKAVYEAKTIKRAHWIQMQYQMMVTKATAWDYVMSDDGVRHQVIPIEPDAEFQKEMLNKALWFWSMVLSKTLPPFTEMDWVPVENEVLAAILDCIKTFKDSKEKAEKDQLAKWREEVFAMVKHPRTICGGAKVLKTEKMKSIKFMEEVDESASKNEAKTLDVPQD